MKKINIPLLCAGLLVLCFNTACMSETNIVMTKNGKKITINEDSIERTLALRNNLRSLAKVQQIPNLTFGEIELTNNKAGITLNLHLNKYTKNLNLTELKTSFTSMLHHQFCIEDKLQSNLTDTFDNGRFINYTLIDRNNDVVSTIEVDDSFCASHEQNIARN